MNAHLDKHTAKRRKVRKGTHSCWECKRRKVKCVFALSDDATCITCHRRGTKCISQEVFDDLDVIENNKDLTERVDEIYDEPVGKSSGTAQSELRNHALTCATSACLSIPSTPGMSLHGTSPQHFAYPSHDRQIGQSPYLPMPLELSPTAASRHVSIVEPNRYRKITQALLRSLPSQRDIEILLGKLSEVSMSCYRANYKHNGLMRKEMPKEQISLTDLLHPESHPVLLTRQIFLLVAALQYLSPDEAIPDLTEHHHVIMEKLAESAIQLVTSNDVLLSTLEGLENIILESFYHVDGGNIRRAWVTMRRAVTAAQLLGLHRPGHYRFKLINDQNDLDPEVMWTSIVCMERGLSLLLGLPTSTGATSSAVRAVESIPVHDGNMTIHLMSMTAKILERNEIRASQQALDMTREIDRELIKMTEKMPSALWRPLEFSGLEIDSEDAYWETWRAWDQICYYNLVNQLHLPYMLCSRYASQNIYSRIACVNASREILTRQIAIRNFNPVTPCRRMGDFMALIAGMTLMLAHVVSWCDKERDNLLVHQRLGDRATVERALECMKSMSEVHEDVLAAKCATLLKHLLAAEADAARGQNSCPRNLQQRNGDHENDRYVLIIKVPYVGAIRIARGDITFMAPSKMARDRGLYEGVTIGGIGSVYVNSPGLPDHVNGDGTAGFAAPQATTRQAMNAPSTQEHMTDVPQVTLEDLFVSQDQMFPDAAAGMDDWVFQGFDTAFFDVLMRGSGDS